MEGEKTEESRRDLRWQLYELAHGELRAQHPIMSVFLNELRVTEDKLNDEPAIKLHFRFDGAGLPEEQQTIVLVPYHREAFAPNVTVALRSSEEMLAKALRR